MNRIIKDLKFFKWLFSNRILTLNGKTFKVPLYVRFFQCVNRILRELYTAIWNIIPLPYSEKWYYRFLPHIGIDNWWFNKKINNQQDESC